MKKLLLLFVLVVPSFAQAAQHGIHFAWSEATPNTTFRVYCGTATGVYPAVATATGIAAFTFDWSGGVPGTQYFCVIRAVSTVGIESGNSNEVVATFPAPPSSPTNATGTPF
jgi:hypothetical protein